MKYSEEKKKVEAFFGRGLSDREFAEVLLNKISYIKDEYATTLNDILNTLSECTYDIQSYAEDIKEY